MNRTLRKPLTEWRYQRYIKSKRKKHPEITCDLCDEVEKEELLVKRFESYDVIRNRFPYDRHYSEHFIVMTKTHFETFERMETVGLYKKLIEKHDIQEWLQRKYGVNQYLYNTSSTMTVPNHDHYHALKLER